MLAIAMNNLGIQQDKQRLLVGELPKEFGNIEFNPDTFSSGTRTEALCTSARLLIDPAKISGAVRDRLFRLMESSASLSTQENFWLLVAFKAMMKATRITPVAGASPKPEILSANARSAGWGKQDLAKLTDFAVNGLKPGGSFVLRAEYRTAEKQTKPVTQGMKVDRVVRNVTDASRDGSALAPSIRRPNFDFLSLLLRQSPELCGGRGHGSGRHRSGESKSRSRRQVLFATG